MRKVTFHFKNSSKPLTVQGITNMGIEPNVRVFSVQCKQNRTLIAYTIPIDNILYVEDSNEQNLVQAADEIINTAKLETKQ